MRVIAISGKKGSGKDTLADFLVANGERLFGGPAIKMGLADPIKEDLVRHFGADREALWGACDRKETTYLPGTGYTLRMAMKEVGAVYARMEPTHFLRLFLERVEREDLGLARVVVVNDLRLKVEAEALHEVGACLIRLERNAGVVDTHKTEVDLDSYARWNIVVHPNLDVSGVQRHVTSMLYNMGWAKEYIDGRQEG